MHPDDVLLYFPVDFPPVIRRVFSRMRPDRVILTESELWPNLWRRAPRGIPLVLINGRISDRSFARYRRLRACSGRCCGCSTCSACRGAGRGALVALGADRTGRDGTAKYDVALQSAGDGPGARDPGGGGIRRRPWSCWADRPGRGRRTRCLTSSRKTASRAVAGAGAAARRAARRGAGRDRARGLSVVRRRCWPASRRRRAPDVLLVDTTGELRLFTARRCDLRGEEPDAARRPELIEPAARQGDRGGAEHGELRRGHAGLPGGRRHRTGG